MFFFARIFLQYFEPFLKDPKNIPSETGGSSWVVFLALALNNVNADLILKNVASVILHENFAISAGREIN